MLSTIIEPFLIRSIFETPRCWKKSKKSLIFIENNFLVNYYAKRSCKLRPKVKMNFKNALRQ